MWRPLAIVALLAGLVTGCDSSETPQPDGGMTPPPDAPSGTCGPSTVPPDFYGEACTNAPDTPAGEPVLTLCHFDAERDRHTGWCVAGTCRPSCTQGCRRCEHGREIYDPRYGCYCEP